MAKRDFFFSISLSLFKYTSLSSIFERWFYSSCQLEMMNSTDDTAHKQISTVINRFLCSGMYLMDAPHVRQYNSIQMWNEQYKREFRLVLVSFQNKNCFSIFIFILFLSFNFTYTHTLTGRSCSTNNLSFASEQWIAIVFFFILLCLLMFVGFSVPFSTKLLLFDSCFFFASLLSFVFYVFSSFMRLFFSFQFLRRLTTLVFLCIPIRVPCIRFATGADFERQTVLFRAHNSTSTEVHKTTKNWNRNVRLKFAFNETKNVHRIYERASEKTMFVTTTIIDLARLIIRIDAWEFVIFSLHSIANDTRNRSCLLFSTLLAVYWS